MESTIEGSVSLLHPDVRNMLEKLGVTKLTEAQEKFIPHVLRGENALLLSPTGSGKTEAAMLPIFSRILWEKPRQISTLFVTPLRSLNRDMVSRLVKYGDILGLRVQVRHSDVSQAEKRKIVVEPADILVTTPESLQILINGKRLRDVISRIKYVIVDELHETAQNERGSQFAIGISRLRDICGDFQIIGLSATVGNPEELSQYLSPVREAKIVSATPRKIMDITVIIPDKAPSDASEKMGCEDDYAGAILHIWNLINSHRGTLVFVNTRSVAEDIAFRLKMYFGEIPVHVHHGSLSREARETAETKFKSGEIKALICTSSLELGIDIGSADLVIQFNSPRQINKLIQRVGRSGHWIEKISMGEIVCSDIIELEEASAIVSYVLEGHLENIAIRKNSLATVVNQIISEINIKGRIDADTFYNTVKKTYPFRNLEKEDFIRTVEFLASTGKIWFENNEIRRRRGILNYYLENISMIPSEKNYKVIDVINKKFIGTLDERYVVDEIEPGSYFVIKGSTWRTIRLDSEKIFVEPFATAAIAPKWSGEDIPVLMDVTTKVSENRKRSIIPEFVSPGSRSRLMEWYGEHNATMDRVVIETRGGENIIQILLGTKGNFALAEILSMIVTSITGESVEMDYSPYHIYIRSSRKILPNEMERIIRGIDPEKVEEYVKSSARRSRFFTGVFLYEAKKFGVISNDADLNRIRFEKIVDAYRESPLFTDSIRKLMFDYMDMDTLKDYLLKMNRNEVQFECRNSISQGSEVFLRHYSERVAPLKPTKTILDTVKKRLMNEEVTLYCTSCGNVRTQKIRDIKRLKCPECGSSLVASLSPFEREMLNDQKNYDLARTRNRISKNAHLIRERGMQAVIVLAARGIGPETASRLLEVSYSSEDDMIRSILTAEIEFAKNKRFWD
ncbi:DEAD/DEAH box helicase [Oxyplasma meridianum]|uniref:DEAD/DEAH box helicase n=1 Tax=Oxyplasma meridianum TaxID=3073602 RepID=A0AAX4NGR7_9ARCH